MKMICTVVHQRGSCLPVKAQWVAALVFGMWGAAHADTSEFSVAPANATSGASAGVMEFVVTRSGDLSYDSLLSYRTVDGSGQAGVDYTATSGSLLFPAGTITGTIPVSYAAWAGGSANRTFQLVIDGATGIGPEPSFGAHQDFTTGPGPFAVTTCDLNGDGKRDIITVNPNEDSTFTLLNETAPGALTPSFGAPFESSSGAGRAPTAVICVDLNGDGKRDVVTTDPGTDVIAARANLTPPGAVVPAWGTRRTTQTAGPGARSLRAVDLDADAIADFVIADGGAYVSIVRGIPSLIGPDNIGFRNYFTLMAAGSTYSVDIADFNSDGKPDIVTANGTTNNVSVLLNTTAQRSSISFATQQSFPTQSTSRDVAAADINGDGRPDLVVANGAISVLLNTTAAGAAVPSFAPQQVFASGAPTSSIGVADLNGDGRPDVVAANDTVDSVSVLSNRTALGAGLSNFAPPIAFATGDDPGSLTVADMNGDGRVDLIASNRTAGSVSVLLNTTATAATSGGFSAHAVATELFPESVSLADVNTDGRIDLVVANAGGTVSVLRNNARPGSDIPEFGTLETFTAASDPGAAASADLNNDWRPDIVATSVLNFNVSALLGASEPGAATSIFLPPQAFSTAPTPRALAFVDLNGDSKIDIVTANGSGSASSHISVLENSTHQTATTPSFETQTEFSAGGSPFAVISSELNGDGRPDLVTANRDLGAASVLLNSTTGNYSGPNAPSFAPVQYFAAESEPHAVASADVNGDGMLDLIAANRDSATLSVLLNATAPGATTLGFSAQQAFAADAGTTAVAAVDIDLDGKTDLVSANRDANTVSILRNATVPGAAVPDFASAQAWPTGAGPQSLATSDLNGDGMPDLVTSNRGSSTLSVLLNTRYQVQISGSPAIGTIVNGFDFSDGFE